ncbi:MAG: leucine-rich repeat domain-containing protein [Balneolaceae bacterium]|nr:leucine-rich repeat domain-containing protein [Balneolaceae bacterium]
MSIDKQKMKRLQTIVMSFLLFCISIISFFGCNSLDESDYDYGRFYTIEEALKNPNKVLKLDLGDYHFRRNTNKKFSLDSSIARLVNLEEFSFTCNYLDSIPTEIVQLPKLKHVTIVDADNMGAPRDNCELDFPDTFRKLAQIESLESLYLPYVKVKIPSEISLLQNISTLTMVFNGLQSLPPEIGDLTNLKELYINYNELKDLPNELSKLKSLRSLSLGSNNLEAIPPEILNLKGLKSLDLAGNEIERIPTDISKLENLSNLNLSFNSISTFPSSTLELDHLRSLDIGHNHLYELPSEIKVRSKIKFLNVSSNSIKQIPEWVFRQDSLEYLLFANNSITEISIQEAFLPNLKTFNGSENSLKEIPSFLFNSTKLEQLTLYQNSIDELPNEIGSLKKLKYLNLADNTIKEIPKVIFELDSLSELRLDFNKLVDVPVELFESTSIDRLGLSGNLFNTETIIDKAKSNYAWLWVLDWLIRLMPLFLGIFFSNLALKSNRTGVPYSILCFRLILVLLLIGLLITWFNAFFLIRVINLNFLYVMHFYEHWYIYWLPITFSVITAIPLTIYLLNGLREV